MRTWKRWALGAAVAVAVAGVTCWRGEHRAAQARLRVFHARHMKGLFARAEARGNGVLLWPRHAYSIRANEGQAISEPRVMVPGARFYSAVRSDIDYRVVRVEPHGIVLHCDSRGQGCGNARPIPFCGDLVLTWK